MTLSSEPVPYKLDVFISKVRVFMIITRESLGPPTPVKIRLVFAQCLDHHSLEKGQSRLLIRVLSRNGAEERTTLHLTEAYEVQDERLSVKSKQKDLLIQTNSGLLIPRFSIGGELNEKSKCTTPKLVDSLTSKDNPSTGNRGYDVTEGVGKGLRPTSLPPTGYQVVRVV